MTAYRMACNEPDFCQSVPHGKWTREPDPMFPASYRYRNDDTGVTVLVPAVWYTGTAASRAEYLRFNADRCDENAARHDQAPHAWSPADAARSRRQARQLRYMADLFDTMGSAIAGHVSPLVDCAVSLLTGFARGATEGRA